MIRPILALLAFSTIVESADAQTYQIPAPAPSFTVSDAPAVAIEPPKRGAQAAPAPPNSARNRISNRQFAAGYTPFRRFFDLVNQIRRNRGLPQYRYSARLTMQAKANAERRAQINHHGHLPVRKGGRYYGQYPPLNGSEGTEHWTTRFARPNEFWACGIYDNGQYNMGYIYAGAWKVQGPNGHWYCTLRTDSKP